MDFLQDNDSDYEALKAATADLDISILINNVGASHDFPVMFTETPEDEMKAIIKINVTGTLRITRLLAPGMVQRKRGLILTMASFAGLIPNPLLATYCGSKAFLQQWSTALGSELKGTGVHVELVQLYFIAAGMSKIRRANAFIPTPQAYIKAVLGKIGCQGSAQSIAYTSVPYWSHALIHWGADTFLGTMNWFLIDRIKDMNIAIRKRALKKRGPGVKKAQ